MQIDLFTLVAQIINFIILLVLLRIFLYKPVVNAMNAREEKIASRLREAEEKRQQAEEEAQKYQQQRREIDEERDRVLAEARKKADERRDELMQQAREEVDERREEWHQAIRHEKDRFLRDLQQRAESQIIHVMRQALNDLADAELENQMVQLFLHRLDDKSDDIASALETDDRQLTISSSFEMPDDRREQIASALREHIDFESSPHFDRDSELVCGIALRTGDYRIGWNLKQYLEAMERDLRHSIDDEIQQNGQQNEDEDETELESA